MVHPQENGTLLGEVNLRENSIKKNDQTSQHLDTTKQREGTKFDSKLIKTNEPESDRMARKIVEKGTVERDDKMVKFQLHHQYSKEHLL